MKFPTWISEMENINEPVISCELFEKANLLFDEDRCSDSLEVLQEGMYPDAEGKNRGGGIEIFKVLFLVGRCLISIRRFSSFLVLEDYADSLGLKKSPEMLLLSIRKLGFQGKNQEVLDLGKEFLSSLDARKGNQEKGEIFGNQKQDSFVQLGNETNAYGNEYLVLLQNDVFIKLPKLLGRPGLINVVFLFSEFLVYRGIAHYFLGEKEKAQKDFELSYALFSIENLKVDAAKVANNFGTFLKSIGRHLEAINWFHKAETVFIERNLLRKISMVRLNQGVLYYKIGNFDKAKNYLNQSLVIGIEGNWSHRQCFAHIALGRLYCILRDFSRARKHLGFALNLAQELSMNREEVLTMEFLGDVARDEGNIQESMSHNRAALRLAEPLAQEGDLVSDTNLRIGECHMLAGQASLAWPYFEISLQLTEKQENKFDQAVTLRVMAEAFFSVGNLTSAYEHIQKAITIFDEIRARYELAIAQYRLSEIMVASREADPENTPVIVRLNQAWHESIAALKYFQSEDLSWWRSRAQGLVKKCTELIQKQEKIDIEKRASMVASGGQNLNPKGTIIHRSQAMQQVLDMCDLYSGDDTVVLIQGETGTGKDLLARRVHEKSKRTGNFVAVNVASISETLFEREFFGHVKGAFSGAEKDSIGFAELANGGTLFLDEIGELSLELQAKLLRLLQDGTFHAVGDPSERTADIRLVAATNLDLYEAVQQKKFREDLFYRLDVLALTIPALRERTEDVIPLMEYFLSQAAGRIVGVDEYLNLSSRKVALLYDWPGNVREVISVCTKLHLQVSNSGSARVKLGRSGALVLTGPDLPNVQHEAGFALLEILDPEKRLKAALIKAGGKKAEAARLLGISRSTLYRQIRQFGL